MAKVSSSNPILQYVSFALGKETFALDVMKIRGVERISEITVIPKCPDFVEGVINLRGEIIPIVDMHKRFGMPEVEKGKEARVVLVEMRDIVVGLIVDKVFEVFQLELDKIGNMPTLGHSKIGRQFIKGVAEVKDRLVIVLEVESLFTEEEALTLSNNV